MLKDKIIGILGGIGPESSGILYLELIKSIQKNFNLESTADYPQIIMNSIAMKDLIYMDIGEGDMKPILKGLKELDNYTPDCNAIICNSAYSFYDYLSKNTKTKLIDLQKIVYDYLITNNISKIGVLATKISISKVYNYKNMYILKPSIENQLIIDKLITNFNKGIKSEEDEFLLTQIINTLIEEGAEKIILGCTEIELIGRGINNTINPMELLINEIIEKIKIY